MYKNRVFLSIFSIVWVLGTTGYGSTQDVFIGCYSEQDVRKVVITGFYTFNECIGVCQKKYYRYAVTQDNVCICSNFLGTEYGPRPCEKICAACASKSSLYDIYYTGIVVPGPPQDLQIYNITNTSASVSWKEPESYVDVKQYEIKAQILHSFSQYNMMSPKWIFSNNTFDTELNFHPGTKYSVNLYAVGKDGEGIAASKIVETEIGSPDNIPPMPNILKRDVTTMVIQLNPVINNNGPITAYQVIVINDDMNQVVELENIKSYTEATNEGLSYYITGEISPNNIFQNFVIGDGRQIDHYFNAPLQPNVNYRVLLCAISQYNNVTKIVYSNFTDVLRGTITMIDDVPTSINKQEGMPKLIFGLYIAIGFSTFVLISGIIGFFLLTKQMKKRRRRFTDTQELTLRGPIIEVENNSYVPEAEFKSANRYQQLVKRIWSIPPNTVRMELHSLGIGKFGRIAGGIIAKDEEDLTVALYTISNKQLTDNKVAILKELEVLIRSGKQQYVINLVGICVNRHSVFFALEYASMNLKDLLLGSRDSLPGRFTDLEELCAIKISVGIAMGMKHLESLKIYHKQLCARNILITEQFTPKISGFGLAQYYNPNLVPDYTRWTASEAFTSSNYISKCDVWSFACVLWEICAMGGTPYGVVPNNELPSKILSGLRLIQLPYISDSMYELMLNCWQLNVDERPTFGDLIFQLENILNDDITSHLSFNKYPGFHYEQFYPDLEFSARTVY